MEGRTGILLVNTGTPANPSTEAIRAYLSEFLSDPMLISVPPIIWKQVLNHFILPRRPQRTAKHYEKLWDGKSFPFMTHSRRQRDLIDAELRRIGFCGGDFDVVLAMRYGEPSMQAGLDALRASGCTRIVAVPLYPQQVRVCAGTCFKHLYDCLAPLRGQGWSPEVIEVPSFYRQRPYLAALAKSVLREWEYEPGAHLLCSWHSTPMADVNKRSDPYRVQNYYTAQTIAHLLGMPHDDWTVVYQSRFDTRRWLSPFLGPTLKELAERGVSNVCVVCPGFVSDCLETLVEVDEVLRGEYLAAAPAGSRFTYVPCLNEDPGLIEGIVQAILEAIGLRSRLAAQP